MNDGNIDLWASHLPVLVEAVIHTDGPVLELGCGHYSTPILHVLCAGRRRLLTIGEDPRWTQKFADLRSPGHEILCLPDPRILAIPENPWDVVFVDGRPDYERPANIAAFRPFPRLFVVNNTEPGHPDYGYDGILPTFPHRFDFKRHVLWTSVVSDVPLPEWVGKTV